MTVRYARRNELQRINEIRKTVNEIHVNGRPDIFRSGFCKELENHIFEIYDSEDADVIAALIDGEICGYVTAQYITRPLSAYNNEHSYYHIEEFGVDAEFRRSGVATAMIGFCREEARKKGFDRIELDMWEFNETALEFYYAIGFSTYRRHMELKI